MFFFPQAEDFKYVVFQGKVHEIQDEQFSLVGPGYATGIADPWVFGGEPLQISYGNRCACSLSAMTPSPTWQETLPDGRICAGERLEIDPATWDILER